MPLVNNDTVGAITRTRIAAWAAQSEYTEEVAMADAATLQTAKQVIDRKIFTQTPTAARAVTTPTAALIVGYATGYVVGTSFEFTIVNKAAATHVITLTAGVGVTLVGLATVAATLSGTWIVRIDSASAVSMFRK